MEGRILVAVFASILALAVGVNGGAVDDVDLSGLNSEERDILNGVFPSSMDIFSSLSDRPEPVKDATLEIDISGEETLKFSDADVTPSGLNSYSAEDFSISSDDNITVKGFNGETVFSGNSSEFSGEASGYISSGVNSSSSFGFETAVESDKIVFSNVDRVEIKFEDVQGNIDTGSINTQLNGSDLNVNSFSGDITTEGGSLVFEGRIHTLESGDLTVGGSEEEDED